MIQLPTQRSIASTAGPAAAVLYGRPKVGKSAATSFLPEALIINVEPHGYDHLSVLKVEPRSLKELYESIAAATGRFRFVVFDAVDTIEKWCEEDATAYYRTTVEGKNFSGRTVCDLANGYGYKYLRWAWDDFLDKALGAAPHVIFIGHTRDKLLKEKEASPDVASADIDLTAGTGRMLFSKCGANGNMTRRSRPVKDVRDPRIEDLWISFKTSDTLNAGSRGPLAGKEFLFWDVTEPSPRWEIIYPEIKL